jgi:trigger factor
MQISVETIKALQRKINVIIPKEEINTEVQSKLRNAAQKAKIDGFRPGKAPLEAVKKRFLQSIMYDVGANKIQNTLRDALLAQDLKPASQPKLMPWEIEMDKDFNYSAIIELFPEITIKELEKKDNIEIIKAEVEEQDIEKMLENMRKHHQTWLETDSKAKKDNKLFIDFEGFLDEKSFEGGTANNFEIVIGSKKMIPGFEEGLIGHQAGDEFDLAVTFPEDYSSKDLAGKAVNFKITVNKVMQGKLPELNDVFAAEMGIKEGGIAALKKDIKKQMERELNQNIEALNRDKAFDELLKINTFDLPESLIEEEIQHMKHELFHRIYGNEHHENEKIPDFPRELFIQQATKRVHLGLLINEYVEHHKLVAQDEQVDAKIKEIAFAYDEPEKMVDAIKKNKNQLASIQAWVLEQIVANKILEHATVNVIKKSYDDVMKKGQEQHSGE